jgi:hypothetical protein
MQICNNLFNENGNLQTMSKAWTVASVVAGYAGVILAGMQMHGLHYGKLQPKLLPYGLIVLCGAFALFGNSNYDDAIGAAGVFLGFVVFLHTVAWFLPGKND